MRSIIVKASNAAYRHKSVSFGVGALAAVLAVKVHPNTYFWG